MIYERRTIHNFLRDAEESFGEQDAYCLFDEKGQECRISFRKLRKDADALSVCLLNMGLCHGQIALFGENSYEWILSFFAIIGSGNTAVPMDIRLSADEALNLFCKTDCIAVICSDTYEDMAQTFEKAGLTVILMHNLKKMISTGSLLLSNRENCQLMLSENRPKADEPAAVYFTSGTTGELKGVILTQRNLISDAVSSDIVTKENVDTRCNSVLLLPLNHTFSMIATLQHIISGNCMYIIKNLRNLLEIFQKAQPGMICSVPMMMENFLLQSRKLNKGNDMFGGKLKTVFCGGSFVSKKCIDAYQELGIDILPGYGITECSSIVSICVQPDSPEYCMGFPMPCVEIKIAEDGEILIRGESVFYGYYNDPEATAAAFRDGWFLTGDIGYLDQEGRLYVTGRKKNLIILSNGENVSAEELERKITRFPYVKEVLVYGENNTIVAEVYLGQCDENIKKHFYEDIERLNRTLPFHKKIGKTVVRTTEFPKTSSMKIIRDPKAENT